MAEKKKKIIFAGITVLIAVILFFAWYNENVAKKPYVKFGGEYYTVIGAVINEENVVEYVGEIERITPRTLWNKDGDSNFSIEGARIGLNEEGEYFVEWFYYAEGGDEINSKFFWMKPEK